MTYSLFAYEGIVFYAEYFLQIICCVEMTHWHGPNVFGVFEQAVHLATCHLLETSVITNKLNMPVFLCVVE